MNIIRCFVLAASALILGSLASAPAWATNPVTEIATGDIPEGTLGLGFGWRWGDSPYKGIDDISSVETDESSDVLPFYYYEGKFLFAHGSTAGGEYQLSHVEAIAVVCQSVGGLARR